MTTRSGQLYKRREDRDMADVEGCGGPAAAGIGDMIKLLIEDQQK